MSFASDMLTKAKTAYEAALDLFATGRAPKMITEGDQTVTWEIHLENLLKQVDIWQARVDAESARGNGGRNRIRTGRV